jgi:hypothetical protein
MRRARNRSWPPTRARPPARAGRRGAHGRRRGSPHEVEDGARAGAGVPLLRFSLPRNPDVIAGFLRTRVLRPDSEVWLSGLNALHKWVAKHRDAQVPLHAVVPIGTTESGGDDGGRGTYALGAWVSEQRRAFRTGTLKAWAASPTALGAPRLALAGSLTAGR